MSFGGYVKLEEVRLSELTGHKADTGFYEVMPILLTESATYQ
jgi:hypothetical protein